MVVGGEAAGEMYEMMIRKEVERVPKRREHLWLPASTVEMQIAKMLMVQV